MWPRGAWLKCAFPYAYSLEGQRFVSTPQQKRDKSKDLAVIGTTIAGKYKVLNVLGQGGFGSVFLVEIVAGMVGEKLALKLIPPQLSGDPKIKEQFLNEIRVAMRMVNKYVVQIRDVGETETGQLYYTMDYCPGENLSTVVKREGKLDPTRAISISLRILEALKTAHAAGVIHRDLKPANVMVITQDAYETVRVLDFGIATALNVGRAGGTGFVGSPHYMPPEQFINGDLGFYTDTYAVGVILYECLTGERPYKGSTAQEVYNDLKSRPVVPPAELNPDLRAQPGLSELIARALERNPDLRFPTAKEMFNELKAVLDGKSEPPQKAAPAPAIRRRPAAIAPPRTSSFVPGLAIGSGIAVLAVLAFIFMNDSNPNALPQPAEPPPTVVTAPQEPTPPPPEPPPPEPPTGSPGQPIVIPLDSKGGSQTPRADPAAAKREAEAKANQLIAEAAKLAQAGNAWDKVREACDDAIGLGASTPELFRLKGLSELKLGMHNQAVESLEIARLGIPGEKQDASFLMLCIEARRTLPNPDQRVFRGLLIQACDALKREPKNVEAAAALIPLLEEQGGEAEVVEIVERAKSEKLEHPEIDRAHQKYVVDLPKQRAAQAQEAMAAAKKAFEAKDYKLAASKAEEGLREHPLPDLGLIQAEALLETGKEKDAVVSLGKNARFVTEPEGIARVGILYSRAHIGLYTKGGEKSPESIERAAENLAASLEVLKSSKSKSPQLVAAVYTYRARLAALQSSLPKVDEEVKSAREDDRFPPLIYHQAESYFILGERISEPDKSAAFLRTISRLGWYGTFKEVQRDPKAVFLGGLCYLRMGGKRDNFSKADSHFARAEVLGMKTAELYEAWAEAQVGLGDMLKAAQKYRDAFFADPTEERCIKAANTFIEANQRIAAAGVLEKGQKLFPRSTRIKQLLDRVSR